MHKMMAMQVARMISSLMLSMLVGEVKYSDAATRTGCQRTERMCMSRRRKKRTTYSLVKEFEGKAAFVFDGPDPGI